MKLLGIVVAFVALMALTVPAAEAESASNGSRTLTVSKASGLSPDGETIYVSGSGFDESKGIYVALCVIPAPGGMPSPCGGGADIGGTGGVSLWISSNPPSYGVGLAIPYGAGGSFGGSLTVGPAIGNVDCRVTACAITTRSDHTRLADRSQDVFVPVSFASAQQPTAVPPTATNPPAPTATSAPGSTATAIPSATATATTSTATAVASATTLPSSPTTVAIPGATVSSDGKTATRGSMTLTSSKAAGLNASGEQVSVTGRGYDETRGIYVALCAVGTGGALGRCASGSTETTAWVSSNPPSYANGRAKAYSSGGSFEVQLTLEPVIDDETDCRKLACAIATRDDDTVTSGTPQELLLPVTFAAAGSVAEPTTALEPVIDAAPSDEDEGGSALPFIVAGVAIVAMVAGGAVIMRKRAAAGVASMVVLLLLGSCGGSSGSNGAATVSPDAVLPVTVHSADGRDVTITDNTRIVALWGNITEVLYGLGLGDHMVGRDVTSTLQEAAHLPEVTKAHDVSVEGVLSLNPTLVIGSMDNTGPDEAIAHLRNIGIPVVLLEDPKTVQDIVPRIQLIAKMTGVPERGVEMAAKAEAELKAVLDSLPADQPHPKVAFLYMRGNAGVYLIGGPGSGADSMIAAAGGQDAGSLMGLANAFTPLTSEALARAAPDVILMTQTGLDSVGGVEGLVKIPGIAQTPAGQLRRIITIGEDLLYNYGPRTPAAIELLSDQIYAAVKGSR